jgi:beta-lactamase class A
VHEPWQRISEILAGVEGFWGLSYLHLNTGERFALNGDEAFYPASVIKVPVMCAVFHMAEYEGLDLSAKVTINRDDQVGGSGVLHTLTAGAELSVYDLVTLMIVVSDNSATNMCLDLVGKGNVTPLMEKLGLTQTKLYNKLMVVPVERGGRQHHVAQRHDRAVRRHRQRQGRLAARLRRDGQDYEAATVQRPALEVPALRA